MVWKMCEKNNLSPIILMTITVTGTDIKVTILRRGKFRNLDEDVVMVKQHYRHQYPDIVLHLKNAALGYQGAAPGSGSRTGLSGSHTGRCWGRTGLIMKPHTGVILAFSHTGDVNIKGGAHTGVAL